MVNYVRKQATSCVIGSVTFTELMYYAYRMVGSGPGGNLVSPRFVANTSLPIAMTPHHTYLEIKLCVDADEATALYATDYVTVPGTVLSACTVTEQAVNQSTGATVTRTVTLSPSYIQSMEPVKVEEEAEHQPFIITLICMGEPGFGTWT